MIKFLNENSFFTHYDMSKNLKIWMLNPKGIETLKKLEPNAIGIVCCEFIIEPEGNTEKIVFDEKTITYDHDEIYTKLKVDFHEKNSNIQRLLPPYFINFNSGYFSIDKLHSLLFNFQNMHGLLINLYGKEKMQYAVSFMTPDTLYTKYKFLFYYKINLVGGYYMEIHSDKISIYKNAMYEGFDTKPDDLIFSLNVNSKEDIMEFYHHFEYMEKVQKLFQ